MTDVLNAGTPIFSQPEGAGGFGDDPVPWITEGGFTCVMDYALKIWWEDRDVVRDAILDGDPRPLEAALQRYRDRVVEAGGVCYIDTAGLADAPVAQRLLAAAIDRRRSASSSWRSAKGPIGTRRTGPACAACWRRGGATRPFVRVGRARRRRRQTTAAATPSCASPKPRARQCSSS